MCLLLINLYEPGQFLRIVAWIFIPLLLIITFITVWLHQRKKRSAAPAEEQMDGSSGEELLPIEAPEEADTPYKGLLWMKHKYEQYCEETDEKMEKIKEKLAAAENRYLDLLASHASLSTKLEENIRLLANIHKELNRSLNAEDPDTHEQDHAAAPAFSE